MDVLLNVLLPYLISLAAGLRSGDILEKVQRKFKDKLAHQAQAAPAVPDTRSLREQLRRAGEQAARHIPKDEIGPAADQILALAQDAAFQENLAAWLTAWRPKEKEETETALAAKIIEALKRSGVKEKDLKDFKDRYFEMIERDVFSDQTMANWRLHLALIAAFERLDELEAIIRKEGRDTRNEVRDQHRITRQEVEAIVARQADLQIGRYSPEQRDRAEQRYRELALESCDIMDLHNLPESDRHLATRQQELKLRRLYVPLRIQVEITADQEAAETDLERIEKEREARQNLRLEGGRRFPTDSPAQDEKDEDQNRVPPGKRLEKNRRLVLLGDPGSGKTTLLRWIATSYLLRLKQDPGWKDLPDVATLPDNEWLPILVRCRDLAESCKSGSIYDVLCETFRKAQLTEEEAEALQAVIVEKMAQGQALLLVDGLDEIADIGLRARFCRQIERLQIAFPDAPIIVTSRIVGYREMKYRIGRGFEHAVVTGFTREDEDEFASRWCEITELPERRIKATEELIQAIHSSDRIERLAVNPMLLTTLALVKRKVGKLPERRADLYWEAVMVLLNWRSEVDEPIDHREALPQLEYVAYEMCRQGKQRLMEDEILEMLERIREEYPNLRALNKHEPADFLRLLERRTGILLEVGEVRDKGRSIAVFEFRHLTFQEYLAARALVDGRFPGRDKAKSLAQHIAPLAGETGEYEDNWREALRLCAACCGDDDVDDVLLAILTPLPGEDVEETARARAVLALSCLADEPNVSEKVALQIIRAFARQVKEGDGTGHIMTTVDAAAMELVGLEWGTRLRVELIREFCRKEPLLRWNPGGLCAMMGMAAAPTDEKEFRQWLLDQVDRLRSSDEAEAIEAALTIMIMAFEDRGECAAGMVEGLSAMLDKNGPAAHAAAWALYWLSKNKKWNANPDESGRLIAFVADTASDIEAVGWAIDILGDAGDPRAVEPLSDRLADENVRVREAAIEALVRINDPRAKEPLIRRLADENVRVREASLGALARICGDEIDRKLLTSNLVGKWFWIDPQEPFGEAMIEEAARALKMPAKEVRRRYEQLAEKYHLKLGWKH